MNTTPDYLRQIDLNLGPAPGPTMPLDPRALHMFGFESTGQEIRNLSTSAQIFVSFDYSYDQGPGLAPPEFPRVHAILAPGETVRREHHAREHALVWIDPATVPPMAVPAVVRVSAWR